MGVCTDMVWRCKVDLIFVMGRVRRLALRTSVKNTAALQLQAFSLQLGD